MILKRRALTVDSIALLGYVAGALTSLALLPQVIKIYRSRSARDISTGMFIVFCIGIIMWIVYGFAIDSLPVIAANSVSLSLSLIILLLKFKYR
jgi:MtN3 and saliva related transmembrane protein